MLLAPSVHQRIAGAAVKSQDVVGVGTQDRHIGDATDIQHGRGLPGLGKKCLVKRRYQRCALPAGRDVAAAKVGHHVNARQLCQQCRLVQLQGVACAIKFLGPVSHGLAVRAYCADIGLRLLALRQQGLDLARRKRGPGRCRPRLHGAIRCHPVC